MQGINVFFKEIVLSHLFIYRIMVIFEEISFHLIASSAKPLVGDPIIANRTL